MLVLGVVTGLLCKEMAMLKRNTWLRKDDFVSSLKAAALNTRGLIYWLSCNMFVLTVV